MLNDFFINILLLVSVTFVGGHILKEVSISKLKSIITKICTGIFCGLAGSLLIIYSFPVKEAGSLLDFRVYAIILASYVGGAIPSLISACIILVFRILYYGNNSAFVVIVVQLISFVILFYMIDRYTRVALKRWFYKTSAAIIIIIPSYYILLKGVENVQIILLQYFGMLVFAGGLEYILVDYIRTSNKLYRMYKNDSTKDFLTGLYNTRHFDKVLNKAQRRVQNNTETLTCLMVDIDFFKKINDTYGHAVGDLVLKGLAKILIRNTRKKDILARVGGEEFCVLLFDCTKNEAHDLALGINKAVAKHKFYLKDNKYINITVSIGLAIYPEMTANPETLKEIADMALYKAKRSGRNRVCDGDICMK